MRTIWKFPMKGLPGVSFEMPADARILHLEVQAGLPCFWALVDPSKPKVRRQFRIVGTGHPIDFPTDKFVGTYLVEHGAFIFHVFEV
jgi:hypothetical protein